MKLRGKLILSYLLIVVLMLVMGIYSIYSLSIINDNGAKIYNENTIPIQIMGEIARLVEDTRVLILQSVNNNDYSYIEQAEQNIRDVNNLLDKYSTTDMDTEEEEIFASLKSNWSKYTNEIRITSTYVKSGNYEEASQAAAIEAIPFNKTIEDINKLIDINDTRAIELMEDNKQSYKLTIIILSIVIVTSSVLAIIIGTLISSRITTPIKKIAHNVNEVANGDLTVTEIEVKNNDEIGQLTSDFNKMTNNLSKILEQVELSAQQVANSSEQLTASSGQSSKATEQITHAIQEVAIGADRQLSSANNSTNNVAEISNNMDKIAANIQLVTNSSINSSKTADEGNQVITQAVEQMKIINTQTKAVSEAINRLNDNSNQIGKVVAIITDIAGQTNLLALNAAIEAARAGEHGRGFAVVADEVRKLADESTIAAEQINGLISEILVETKKAVSVMDDSNKGVNEGIKLVNNAGTAFKNILQAVDDVASDAQDVSAAIEQITAEIQTMVTEIEDISNISMQVAGNIQNVAASTEEQNASMEEVATAAEMLSKMAIELQDAINNFTLRR